MEYAEEMRAVRPNPPGGALVNECAKEARPRDVSYIDPDPAKQVVLSPRLQELVRRVGGCQTEEVMALVRGIMYEVISQRKY
jgi:hypothetical protein